jgi:hypothetical protein
MEWLWIWSGSPFGYREAGQLWTYDGRHVGRFRGQEIYGPNGHYLGEVMNDDRLIVDMAKKSRRTLRFRRLPDSRARPPGIGFNSVALPGGYQDFPRPARLR